MQTMDRKDTASDAYNRRLLRTRSSADLSQVRRAASMSKKFVRRESRSSGGGPSPNGTALVAHRLWPRAGYLAAFGPIASSTVYDNQPVASPQRPGPQPPNPSARQVGPPRNNFFISFSLFLEALLISAVLPNPADARRCRPFH
jgi:hypothetical protein